MDRIGLTKYLDETYVVYAKSTVENRAIPSIIDGFKPVQRKIIASALLNKSSKFYKVFQLCGIVSAQMAYASGDGPLNDSIINMALEYKNSLPYFDRDGQFGTLRDTESGAPRYIGVRLNDTFSKLIKDLDIVDYLYEDGAKIEPKHYYPIIPTILVNGTKGVAVGHGSDILNRCPLQLTDSIIKLVKGGRWSEPSLYLNGYRGDIEFNDGSWYYNGKYDVVNTTTINITEIPPSMTIESYTKHLYKLLDDGKIKSFDDNSTKYPNFTIKFTRADLKKLIELGGIPKLFKLNEKRTENFTFLDEFKNVQKLESCKQICEYFINYRLGIYEKRKANKLIELNKLLDSKNNIVRFIKMYISGEIKIAKRTISAIEKDLSKFKFDKVDDSYKYLTNIRLVKFTKDEINKLNSEISEIESDIQYYKKVSNNELYITDLQSLKKDISKQFK